MEVLFFLTTALLTHLCSSQSPNKKVFFNKSVNDGGVTIHFKSNLAINPVLRLHWKEENKVQAFNKDIQTQHNFHDVTRLICTPSVISASLQVWFNKLKDSETFDIESELFIRNSVFSCHLNQEYVTVQSNRFKPYCLQNGYVEENKDRDTKAITIHKDYFSVYTDVCNGPATKTLEIFSSYQTSLGFCQFAVPDPALQNIKFSARGVNIVFQPHLMTCVDKVVAHDQLGQIQDMNCVVQDRNQKHFCSLSGINCKTHRFNIFVIYKFSPKQFRAGSFQLPVNLVTTYFSSYSKHKSSMKLGRFNVNKLECFAKTFNIKYGDTEEMVTYKVDNSNRLFELELKPIEQKCENIKVKASLLDIFGKSVYENEVEIKNSRLEGDINIEEIQEDSRSYLSFTTSTAGLLSCYTQVGIGESSLQAFTNPLDITDRFVKSCQGIRINIYLLQITGVQKTQLFTKSPSLIPPPPGTKFEAFLDEEAQTIEIKATPPGPLTCLKVTVNGSIIPLDTTGRVDIHAYFSSCHDQVIQIRVDTDAKISRVIILSQNINLSTKNVFSNINLVYDEESKIVMVEASAETLACAGDRLKVTSVEEQGIFLV